MPETKVSFGSSTISSSKPSPIGPVCSKPLPGLKLAFMKSIYGGLVIIGLIAAACREGGYIKAEGQLCAGGKLLVGSVADGGLVKFEERIRANGNRVGPFQWGYDYRTDGGSVREPEIKVVDRWIDGSSPSQKLWLKAWIYIGGKPFGFSRLVWWEGRSAGYQYCFDGVGYYRR